MESECRIETKKHISQVVDFLQAFSTVLYKRAMNHDKSKLEEPESAMFEKFTPLLKGSTYGSDEYKQFLKDMGPALEHHYENNTHHPEHFISGIKEMNLFDIVEMFCDWFSATRRHADGNILRSIDINEKRFGINEQISQIFRNTVEELSREEARINDTADSSPNKQSMPVCPKCKSVDTGYRCCACGTEFGADND